MAFTNNMTSLNAAFVNGMEDPLDGLPAYDPNFDVSQWFAENPDWEDFLKTDFSDNELGNGHIVAGVDPNDVPALNGPMPASGSTNVDSFTEMAQPSTHFDQDNLQMGGPSNSQILGSQTNDAGFDFRNGQASTHGNPDNPQMDNRPVAPHFGLYGTYAGHGFGNGRAGDDMNMHNPQMPNFPNAPVPAMLCNAYVYPQGPQPTSAAAGLANLQPADMLNDPGVGPSGTNIHGMFAIQRANPAQAAPSYQHSAAPNVTSGNQQHRNRGSRRRDNELWAALNQAVVRVAGSHRMKQAILDDVANGTLKKPSAEYDTRYVEYRKEYKLANQAEHRAKEPLRERGHDV